MISKQIDPGQVAIKPKLHVRPWREIAILGLLVMDLCWLTPWYRTFTPATYAAAPGLVALVFGAILISVHWAARTFNLVNLRVDLRRILLVGLIILNIWLAIRVLLYSQESVGFFDWLRRPFSAINSGSGLIPDEFLVAIFVLILAWRGLSHAQEYIEPATIRRSFLTGLLMFIGYIFFNSIITGETPGLFLYLFFLAGLLAMGTARISVISSLRGGVRIPFDRNWFFGVLVGTTVIVAAASVIAWILSTKLQIIEQVGKILLGLMGLILVAVISPAIFLVQTVIQRSRPESVFLRNALEAIQELQATFAGLASGLLDWMDRIGAFEWAPRLKPFLLWSVLLSIAFLVVAGLARWLIREAQEKGEERENLGAADLFRLLQDALQDRLRKLAENLSGFAKLRAGQHLLAAARIRRIYAQLIQIAERLDKPRPPAFTPLEYLPTLGQLFPGLEQDLEVITYAYLRVRYGELPETQAELDLVEAAWERVRVAGQLLISQKERTHRLASR